MEENIYFDIGGKIKELREKRGVSQSDLAKELGYESDTAISLIEKGLRKVTIDKLKIIAEYFKIDISYFLDSKNGSHDIYTALRSDGKLNEKDINTIADFIDFLKTKK